MIDKTPANHESHLRPDLMPVSMFDMDHTLINNDCDVSWKKFLVKKGWAAADALQKADEFYEQYVAGQLDIKDFLAFQFAEFVNRTPAEMRELAREHCQAMVQSRVYEDARAEVSAADTAGHLTVICTSTNDIIAAPVADMFGIQHLIATRLEVTEGVFTGRLQGPYCGGEGKVTAARAFCRNHGTGLNAVTYYGDSVADIPLLSAVGSPVAVNPAPELRQMAEEKGWPIRSFNENSTC